MARIRTIKPEFWTDEKLVELDYVERLLFIGLFNFVDDQGFIDYKPKRIKMQVFPGDSVDVVAGLSKLHESSLVSAYDTGSGVVLHINNWEKHQRVPNPSKQRYFLSDLRKCDPFGPTLISPNESYPAEGKGREGKGVEGKGTEVARPAVDAAEIEPAKPEQTATAAAYERVGKAFKYVAVLNIVKWAIHTRGANPKAVEDAVVAIYEMGKPITKQVLGQYLDGHLTNPQRRNDIDWDAAMQRARAADERTGT